MDGATIIIKHLECDSEKLKIQLKNCRKNVKRLKEKATNDCTAMKINKQNGSFYVCPNCNMTVINWGDKYCCMCGVRVLF